MDSAVSDLAETGEDILSFDVADVELERAADPSDGRAVTWAICTYPLWYCDLPQ